MGFPFPYTYFVHEIVRRCAIEDPDWSITFIGWALIEGPLVQRYNRSHTCRSRQLLHGDVAAHSPVSGQDREAIRLEKKDIEIAMLMLVLL